MSRGKLDQLGVQQPEPTSVSPHMLSLSRGRGAAVRAQPAACSSDHRMGLAWVLPSFLGLPRRVWPEYLKCTQEAWSGHADPHRCPLPRGPGDPACPKSLPSQLLSPTLHLQRVSAPFSHIVFLLGPQPVPNGPAKDRLNQPSSGMRGASGWGSRTPGPTPGVWGLGGGVSPALLVGVGIRSLVRGRGSDRP